MTVALTVKNFESIVDKDGIVVIDWWAAWCGPCRMFAPIFEAASKRHGDVTWAKIDTDAQQELAGMFQIRSIPTLMLFRDGVLLFERAGIMPAAALDDLIARAREVDMQDVKRQLAEAAAAPR